MYSALNAQLTEPHALPVTMVTTSTVHNVSPAVATPFSTHTVATALLTDQSVIGAKQITS